MYYEIIDLIKEILKEEIIPIELEINRTDVNTPNNKTPYNKKINELYKGKIEPQGIYIWRTISDEIIYVGMSGKIKWNELKTRIEPTNYSIPKRLISSRGRKNNKEIPTWSFLKNEVFKDDVSKIIITIIEIDVSKFSPTYIESCVLQKIYSTKNIIPKFNNHF